MRGEAHADRAPMTGARALALALALSIATFGALALRAAFSRPTDAAPEIALVDQHGRPFTLARERGRSVVLVFGYTHCTDACPTTLANVERALRAYGRAAPIDVALVTVDPRHDDATALGRYAAAFGPNVFGLRGDEPALHRAYDAYHVTIEPPRRGARAGEVEHSTIVYYVARDGSLAADGDWSDTQAEISADLRKTGV